MLTCERECYSPEWDASSRVRRELADACGEHAQGDSKDRIMSCKWRSASAPAFSSTEQIPRSRRPHTLSNAELSPTGYKVLAAMHKSMRNTLYDVKPNLRVVYFDDSIYVMVFIGFEKPHVHMLRPDEWHCTLLRAYWSTDNISTDVIKKKVDLMRERVLKVWNALTPEQQLTLHPPPWQQSWCFGLPKNWVLFFEALRSSCEWILFSIDGRAYLRTRREFHLSWN